MWYEISLDQFLSDTPVTDRLTVTYPGDLASLMKGKDVTLLGYYFRVDDVQKDPASGDWLVNIFHSKTAGASGSWTPASLLASHPELSEVLSTPAVAASYGAGSSRGQFAVPAVLPLLPVLVVLGALAGLTIMYFTLVKIERMVELPAVQVGIVAGSLALVVVLVLVVRNLAKGG